MRKFKLGIALAILVVGAYSVFGAVERTEAQATNNLLECVSVQLTRNGQLWSDRTLNVQNGNVEPYVISARITVRKPANYNQAYDHNGGYVFVYLLPARYDFQEFRVPLNFSSLDNADSADFTTQISIRVTGEWTYRIQTSNSEARRLNSSSSESGCPGTSGEYKFDVRLNDTSTVAVENTLYVAPGRDCDNVNDIELSGQEATHFTCLTANNGDPYANIPFSGSEYRTTPYSACPFPGSADSSDPAIAEGCRSLVACAASKGPDGADLIDDEVYCYPYKGTTLTSFLNHLDICDPTSTTVACQSGTECKPVQNNDSASYRCIVTTQSLLVGQACHMTYSSGAGKECGSDDVGGRLVCATVLGYLGTCRPESTQDACVVDQREQCANLCEAQGGSAEVCATAICVTNTAGGAQCRWDAPDGSDSDPQTPPPQEVSPAAGPCNCGGLRRLCIKDGVFDPTALNAESLGFITGRVNSFNDLNAEEKANSISCYTCITQGNTWTSSFGCVNTTISGLFTTILRLALGVSGGIVLIRLIVLGYQYAFSKEKMKLEDASKNVVATLGGLLLILFSVVILRIIGVNILDVVPPGFFGT